MSKHLALVSLLTSKYADTIMAKMLGLGWTVSMHSLELTPEFLGNILAFYVEKKEDVANTVVRDQLSSITTDLKISHFGLAAIPAQVGVAWADGNIPIAQAPLPTYAERLDQASTIK